MRPHKCVFPLALGLLLALLVAGCAGTAPTPVPAAAPGSQPAIVFDSTTRDCGKVQFDQTCDQTFMVTNRGGSPLALGQVDVRTVEGC